MAIGAERQYEHLCFEFGRASWRGPHCFGAFASALAHGRKEVAAVPALADNACEVRTLLHAVSRDSGILWRWPGPDVGIVRQLRAGPLRATMTL